MFKALESSHIEKLFPDARERVIFEIKFKNFLNNEVINETHEPIIVSDIQENSNNLCEDQRKHEPIIVQDLPDNSNNLCEDQLIIENDVQKGIDLTNIVLEPFTGDVICSTNILEVQLSEIIFQSVFKTLNYYVRRLVN